MTISAVKQGDSNTKCDVGFGNVTKSVALWSQYLNPTAVDIIGDPKVSIDPTGTYVELNTSESGAGNFNLAFDSNGQTKFNLNYDDAGQLQLNAKFTGTGDESGLELTGASNFVSFPASLAVVAKDLLELKKSALVSMRFVIGSLKQVRALAWKSQREVKLISQRPTTHIAVSMLLIIGIA